MGTYVRTVGMQQTRILKRQEKELDNKTMIERRTNVAAAVRRVPKEQQAKIQHDNQNMASKNMCLKIGEEELTQIGGVDVLKFSANHCRA